jgi:3D (Asp-Asp-Asp) domain-containing protein
MGRTMTGRTHACTAATVILAMLIASGPAAGAERRKVGKALLTYYWMVDERASKYRGPSHAVLRDVRGRVLARTSHRFRKALVLEGGGRLRDGRAIMYDRKKGGEHRFRITRAKYGLAFNGSPLVPYRTVAVDPRVIPIGTKIFIPEMKGAVLPDGTTHDGVFVANDRGHFRGRLVDVFVGAGPRGARPFTSRGNHSRSRVTVFRLD